MILYLAQVGKAQGYDRDMGISFNHIVTPIECSNKSIKKPFKLSDYNCQNGNEFALLQLDICTTMKYIEKQQRKYSRSAQGSGASASISISKIKMEVCDK